MIKAGVDTGLIVTIVALILGAINGIITQRNKKKKEEEAKAFDDDSNLHSIDNQPKEHHAKNNHSKNHHAKEHHNSESHQNSEAYESNSSKVKKGNMNELDELFSFSTLSKIEKFLGVEPDPPTSKDHVNSNNNLEIDIIEDKMGQVDELIIEEGPDMAFKSAKLRENNRIEEVSIAEFDIEEEPVNKENKKNHKISLKDSLKSNPKLLILYSEILKPKYQDF